MGSKLEVRKPRVGRSSAWGAGEGAASSVVVVWGCSVDMMFCGLVFCALLRMTRPTLMKYQRYSDDRALSRSAESWRGFPTPARVHPGYVTQFSYHRSFDTIEPFISIS